MTEPTGQEGPQEARPRRKRWRWLRRLALLATLGLIALTAIVWFARTVVFTDDRLRRIAEEQATSLLGVPVTIGGLSLDVASELTIERFVIGPPPGFTRNVLVVDYAHLAWRLPPLLSKTVEVPDLSARGVTAVMEKNARGTNIDALLANIQGDARPPAAEPEPQPERPEPPPKEPLAQPRLPVHVIVSRISFTELQGEMVSPELSAMLDRLGLEGRFEGEGDAMSLDLWMGVGDHQGPTRSRASYAGSGVALVSDQHGGLTVRSSGFGDVDLLLDVEAVTTLSAPQKLPALASAAKARLQMNLLAQTATLIDTSFQLGKGTKVELATSVHGMLGTPTVSIDKLAGGSNLSELSPFISAFAPGVRVGGHIELAAAPMKLVAGAKPTDVSSNISAKASNIHVSAMGNVITDLDANAALSLADGIVGLSADATMSSASAPQGAANQLAATLELTTPIAPWLGEGEGMFAMVSDMRIGHAEAPAASADAVTLHLESTGPIGMLRNLPATAPLRTNAVVGIGKVTASGSLARDINLSCDVSQGDLAASVVDVVMQAGVGSATTPLPQGDMTVPRLTAAMTVRRRGQSVAIPALSMQLGNIMRMTGNASVDAALSQAPRIKSFALDLEPTSLEELINLLPKAARPPAVISGSMKAHAEAKGTLPYVELTALAQAPAIPRGGDVWGATLSAYSGFANRWAKRLIQGLPFSADMSFEVSDVAYTDEATDCDGGHMLATMTLSEHGPSLRVLLEMAKVMRPQTVRDMRWEWTAELVGDHAESKLLGLVGYTKQSGSPLALENTAFEGSARYDLGGDVVIDRFGLSLPTLGTRFEARAAMKAPLDVAIVKSWEQPGLPGLALDAAYELRVANREALALGAGGLAIGGEMTSRGSFVVAGGTAVITGDIRANELSAKIGENALEGLSGSLPFDVRLAFDGRPGTTPLARGLSFGEVGLITEDTTAALGGRPAYYDRLHDYRDLQGVSIRRIQSGPYIVQNFELDGSMANGRLRADRLAMHLLGGDIVGNLDFRLGKDRSLTGDMDFKVSNIDASTFSMLNLAPGPDSEMNADMHMSFVFAPKRRDIDFNMNVTKIGSKTLDRFLQLLDPEEKNESLQRTRGQLKFVRIDNVAMWMRYENLNMDIDVTTFMRIPFTNIGFPNIDRELLRRYSVSEQLDFHLQPHIDKTVAPLLGWHAK